MLVCAVEVGNDCGALYRLALNLCSKYSPMNALRGACLLLQACHGDTAAAEYQQLARVPIGGVAVH